MTEETEPRDPRSTTPSDDRWPPLWTSLRGVGNSAIVKMTIFIPVIGYMVMFNEHLLQYLDLSRYIFGSLSGSVVAGVVAHVSWRLELIYFGLCFLALASLIYHVRCPMEVKRFGTSIDYIGSTLPNLGDIAFGRLEVELQALPRWGWEQKEMQGLFFERDRKVAGYGKRDAYDPAADRADMRERYYRDVLGLNFRRLNADHPVSRCFAIVFYGLGFVTLAIPSLEVFWRVLSVVVRDLTLL